jgi:hypothetical protein
MLDEAEQATYQEWKDRFQSVGRAQARYLYILLIAGVFFLVLHLNIMTKDDAAVAEQEVPLVGAIVSRVMVWATAPIVLGFTLLGALGTFRAIDVARNKLGPSAKGGEGFERLDVNPTVIDFIVYTKSTCVGWLGLLTYPVFLLAIYVESAWIWYCFLQSSLIFPGRKIFLTFGCVILVWCILPLAKFGYSKVKSMLCKAFK